jgi:CheY-like chemotaxis protein
MNTKYNLLWIENDPGDIRLFSEYFKTLESSWNLEIVRDGRKALRALEKAKKTPDLIVLDLNVPKIGGMDLLMLIKACHGWQHIPVVIFSDSMSARDIARAREMDALKYVSKPFEPDHYQAAIDDIFMTWAKHTEESLKNNPSKYTA